MISFVVPHFENWIISGEERKKPSNSCKRGYELLRLRGCNGE